MLVFDVTRKSSFTSIARWLDEIHSSAATSTPRVVLCGNKVDLEDERQVDEATAVQKAEELG